MRWRALRFSSLREMMTISPWTRSVCRCFVANCQMTSSNLSWQPFCCAGEDPRGKAEGEMQGGLPGEGISRSDSRVCPPQERGHQPCRQTQYPGGQNRHDQLAQQIYVNHYVKGRTSQCLTSWIKTIHAKYTQGLLRDGDNFYNNYLVVDIPQVFQVWFISKCNQGTVILMLMKCECKTEQ